MHRHLEELQQQAAVIKSVGYIQHPASFEIKTTQLNRKTQYWWCRKNPKNEPFQWMQISEVQFKKLQQLLENGQALYQIEKQIAFEQSTVTE